jgi:hypothetical protein
MTRSIGEGIHPAHFITLGMSRNLCQEGSNASDVRGLQTP